MTERIKHFLNEVLAYLTGVAWREPKPEPNVEWEDKFYLVAFPSKSIDATRRTTSKKEAEEVALKVAKKTGRPIYVLEVVAVASKTPPPPPEATLTKSPEAAITATEFL